MGEHVDMRFVCASRIQKQILNHPMQACLQYERAQAPAANSCASSHTLCTADV